MKARRRVQYGTGRLRHIPERSVFLNCPFDLQFEELFDALVFATVCCGFMPRCALESGDVAEPRMKRITRAMFSSRYSIHDLSRCTGQGESNHARFNMPLELGIAMARKYTAQNPAESHDWLVLVPEGHVYARFISDLAGFDPATHDGSVDRLVAEVMAWLATRPDAIRTPTPEAVVAAFEGFRGRARELRRQWGDATPPWADLVSVALQAARAAG